MSLVLEIPDEVLEVIKLPRRHLKDDLNKELAFFLYARELVPMGVARKLAGITKWDFIEGLTERGIQRHYYEKELEEDIQYAKGYM